MAYKEKEMQFLSALSVNLRDEDLLDATIRGLIAAEISMHRQDMNLSQKDFAKLMGVSQGLVSRWESGETNFTLSTLAAIAIKLNIAMQSPYVPTEVKVFSSGNNNIYQFRPVSCWSTEAYMQPFGTNESRSTEDDIKEM